MEATRSTIPLRQAPDGDAAAQPHTPPAVPPVHGFDVACILCGEKEISVGLDDVTVFCCEACGSDFKVEDVRGHLAGWQSVLAWCQAAPTRDAN